jgi:hypothetical protein
VWLERIWEAPEGRRDWRVPVVEVEDAIRAACLRYRVLEVAADPSRWQRSLEVLDGDGIPVHEFFQAAARMGPATARFYQLVVDGELTHDGGTPLARHVANAILREHSRGARLSKRRRTHRGASMPPSPPSWPSTGPPSSPGIPARHLHLGALHPPRQPWAQDRRGLGPSSRGCWHTTNGHHPRLPPTLSPPIRRRTSMGDFFAESKRPRGVLLPPRS